MIEFGVLAQEFSHAKFVICHPTTLVGMGSEDMKNLDHTGIPNYPTAARAAKALVNMKQYFENRERN